MSSGKKILYFEGVLAGQGIRSNDEPVDLTFSMEADKILDFIKYHNQQKFLNMLFLLSLD